MPQTGGTSEPLIELADICVSFDGGRSLAVDHVSLSIEAGTFVALVGASGSGKTSLLRTINGLITPDRGSVHIDSHVLSKENVIGLRRGIGYVIQNVGLFPHMNVAENIGVTPRLLHWPEARISARVEELMQLVDLPEDYLTRSVQMLSGGQKQRVGVARALAAAPDIVLMDEPFGALDPLTRDSLAQGYRALHDKFGLTTVMVTHDMQEAALLSDRIVVMHGGRIVCDGTPGALLTDTANPMVFDLLNLPRRQAERIQAMISSTGAAR
ncbi:MULTISPECIES: ATP-binding cassette domain-containing protein [unclassified Beijerinckia]|uniref:ATP-binding cassette domain-containing protein n=1 Tax=unclassified Beijerinckia TaxID=2638183 RepID=UPI000897B9A4|nr:MULTISPECIES: ATP-binding cassette domain-containing protein [unclassified Beijerinckia]MDH7796941.1 osmoprotectant transport system ATP-binding protein [Beijerinckia sp. GAS462]SEC66045.1 osmoprotectant transport system ATP-binding protein [Beijerinckia sp. 28-YEA-48]